MKREQIIHALYTQKVIGNIDLMELLEKAGYKDYSISAIIDRITDAILALPLEVPSDEECQQHMTAMNFFQHKDEFDYDVWDEGKLHWAIQGYKIASKWMRNEIIKRNK